MDKPNRLIGPDGKPMGQPSSPKEELQLAITELSVRLEVMEIMMTEVMKRLDISQEDMIEHLEAVFGPTPDSPEGLG